MTDRAWKRQEREVAAAFRTVRNPNTGRAGTDIDAGPFAIEHKARKQLPTWLTEALRQAGDGAGGRMPVVVLSGRYVRA